MDTITFPLLVPSPEEIKRQIASRKNEIDALSQLLRISRAATQAAEARAEREQEQRKAVRQ